ncbi:MAG: TRAP transporter substrate-binding protein [Alphaproteobacteria bacterium]|nr:TRAP transporter substrate-binding protein [Alphaproteobacteria bacterium]
MLMRKCFFATIAMLLAAAPVRAADQEWTWQTSTSAGEIAYVITKEFTDSIETLTGGRLAVRLVPVGSVVQYNETLDAIGSGLLDGHITATVYFSGKDPAFALLGDLIAAYDHPEQMFMFLRHGGGDALLRELMAPYGVHYIGGSAVGKEAFISKIPIRGVDDFAGVKLRAPEGMAQDIFERVGAAPVNLPAAEVFTAVERGVVDAADWATYSMNHQLGFHAIARYPIYPGIHSLPVIDISVNAEKWNALPDDLKAILEMAVRDFSGDITRRLEMQDLADVAADRAEGVEVIDWPKAERDRMRDIAVGIWQDWAGRSEMAGRAYDAQIAYLRAIGLVAEE